MIREGRCQKIRHNTDIDIAIDFQVDLPIPARCSNFN